jgi:transposase InsO family protein
MQALLEERDLWDYVTGDKEKPQTSVASTAAEKARLAEWIKNDAKARRQMILCMSSAELRGTQGMATSKDLWDLLVNRKESSGSAGINNALAALFRAKAETEGDIPEHLIKIRDLQEQIHTQGLKFSLDLPDWVFTAIMINTLPSSWDAFTNAYAGTLAGDSSLRAERSPYRVKSHEMEAILMNEWRRRNPAGTVAEDTALVSKDVKNRGVHTNGKMKCFNCQKEGHKIQDCWAPGGGAEGKGPKQKFKRGKPGEGSHQANLVEETNGSFDVAFTVDTTGGHIDERWVADSASSSHIAMNREYFQDYEPLDGAGVKGLNGKPVSAKGRGTIVLNLKMGSSYNPLTLRNVLYVPDAQRNLVSITRLAKSKYPTLCGEEKCEIFSKGRVIGEGKLTGEGLYILNAVVEENTHKSMLAAGDESISWDEWHRRFGHVAVSALKKLKNENMVNGLTVDLDSEPTECEACIQSKLSHRPFPAEASTRAEKPGELTYSDLWGPARTMSIGGSRYFMSFTDDYSRKCSVVFLRDKSEATEKMQEYITYLERKLEMTPKAIRVDNGKEFINKVLKKWCRTKGIDLQTTAPYSPSQNGVAERFNRTLMEIARAMIIAKGLPHFLWAEAVSYAAYVRNSVPTRALNNRTPYEAWTGKKPDVSHLQEFGSSVWIYDEGDVGKLLPRANKFVFVGYQTGSKAVRYYDANRRSIKVSRNFRFSDKEKPFTVEIEGNGHEGEKLSLEGEQGYESDSEQQVRDIVIEDYEDAEDEDLPVTSQRRRETITIPRRINPPRKEKRVTDYRLLGNPDARKASSRTFQGLTNIAVAYQTSEVTFEGAPKSLREAQSRPDWPEFRAAILEELAQHQSMGTWVRSKLPPDRKAVGCRWVFAIKRNEKGEIVKYKARLVAQGFSQIPGIDYNETFAPVVRFDSLRTILSLAAINNWEVQAIDIKGAYLTADLQEDIYMRQPEGFDDGTGNVLKLVKAIYGLKQAGHDFNNKLNGLLTDAGYTRSPADAGVYIQRRGKKVTVLTVWVDDIVLAGNSKEIIELTKRTLAKTLEIKDLGEPKLILGLEIMRDRERGTISIGQRQYIENMLKRFGFEGMAPVPTPMEANKALVKRDGPPDTDLASIYATAIGSLMYAAIGTRPDIAFAVQNLSQFTSNPGPEHWQAVKRVFRYLSGTRSHQLTYGGHNNSTEVIGYSDADWASNPNDRKSISGYAFLLGGGAITWNSKKQTIVALSSAEAEYVAEAHAAKEAIWLRQLLDSLGFPQVNPTVIWADNQAAIKLTQNSIFHSRTKHIDTRLHFLRDKVQDNTIVYDYVPTRENIADVFTKGLPKESHTRFSEDVGVLPA